MTYQHMTMSVLYWVS